MTQSLSKLLVHVTFSTKGREPFLPQDDLRQELHRYMSALFNKEDSPAIVIGGMPDHLHILFVLGRNKSLSDVMRAIKASSSRWLTRKGVGGFSWQKGFAAFSVSESAVSSVREYIEGQAEHHAKFDFKTELRELLRRHDVAFDERYVWN